MIVTLDKVYKTLGAFSSGAIVRSSSPCRNTHKNKFGICIRTIISFHDNLNQYYSVNEFQHEYDKLVISSGIKNNLKC